MTSSEKKEDIVIILTHHLNKMGNIEYFDLTGKIALITGGATGIGKGIAEGLAEAGANIVIAARRLEKCEATCLEIEQKRGVKTLPLKCDVTSQEDVRNLIKLVQNKFGYIDILVNNAGIAGSEKPILKMEEEDWDIVLETNLKSMFYISKVVAAKMKERGGGGKIINVASFLGKRALPNMSAYCTAKGGCVQLTKVMALEWAKYDIQVNAILPGYIATPMNDEFFASDTGKNVIQSNIPMRRLGQIDELKGVAILLASRASSFMTGSLVVVDGGQIC